MCGKYKYVIRYSNNLLQHVPEATKVVIGSYQWSNAQYIFHSFNNVTITSLQFLKFNNQIFKNNNCQSTIMCRLLENIMIFWINSRLVVPVA